jgi:hypothetical protein
LEKLSYFNVIAGCFNAAAAVNISVLTRFHSLSGALVVPSRPSMIALAAIRPANPQVWPRRQASRQRTVADFIGDIATKNACRVEVAE